MATAPEIECVLDARATTGETPTWCEREQALYWIDVEEPALHRFDPATGEDVRWPLADEIGCFVLPNRSGAAIVALRSGIYRLDLTTGKTVCLTGPPYDPSVHRFNEGACDAAVRFWVGTMFAPTSRGLDPTRRKAGATEEAGALRYFTPDEGLVERSPAAIEPNGLAWSPNNRTMFFAHTEARTIFAFDFDVSTASLNNRRVFATIPESIGKPDGGTVDAEGCYWSGIYGGGRLIRFTPSGTVDREIRLPVSCPTMCAFGGSTFEDVYIASASKDLDAARAREPLAGGLFRLRPGVRGLPVRTFAG
ncbi:MAG: SMP-30/gluconolactonase/LRE family protein [Methylocella sp.]